MAKDIDAFFQEWLAGCLGKFHRHHYHSDEVLDLLSCLPLQVERVFDMMIEDSEVCSHLREHFAEHSKHILQMIEGIADNPTRTIAREFLDFCDTLKQHWGMDYPVSWCVIAKHI